LPFRNVGENRRGGEEEIYVNTKDAKNEQVLYLVYFYDRNIIQWLRICRRGLTEQRCEPQKI